MMVQHLVGLLCRHSLVDFAVEAEFGKWVKVDELLFEVPDKLAEWEVTLVVAAVFGGLVELSALWVECSVMLELV